jgi:hypothetical protein
LNEMETMKKNVRFEVSTAVTMMIIIFLEMIIIMKKNDIVVYCFHSIN